MLCFFNKGYMLIFLKRASFLASSRDGPVLSVHNLGDSYVCCYCYQFFFLVFYERLRIFFSVLTFGLPGKTSVMHHLLTVIKKSLT